MKLSHRDFRPQRRSKYVSQPPTRRPTLRILLLAAFGAVVYLKFDSFVSSRIFQILGNPHLLRQVLTHQDPSPAPAPTRPSSPGVPPNAAMPTLKWSADSNLVDLVCASAQIDPCLAVDGELGSEAFGSLHALIQKAEMRWDVVPAEGFSARLQKIQASQGDSVGWQIQRLELSSASGNGPIVILAVESAGRIRFCHQGQCLDDSAPIAPFVKFANLDHPSARPPRWEIQPEGSPVFHSILPGRIVEILSQAKSVKIYHGRNIFSTYGGFAELRPDLRPGSTIDMKDTLGLVERNGDTLGFLSLRIEKDGVFVDPLAFLGITADTGTAADGR